MNYIIAVTNQKGGTGKTTSTINIGAGLARKGYKVLLIDLDPQGSLTFSAGVDVSESNCTVYELLKGACNADQAITTAKAGNYEIIPADIRLAVAEMEFSGIAGREQLLREALQPVSYKYDFILIDCSPSLGVLTLNALAFADEVYIPLQAEPLALAGMSSLLDTIATVNRRINPNIEVAGIIVTMFDSRNSINKYIIDKLGDKFTNKLFKTRIRKNITLADATTAGLDIFAYNDKCNGAKDYTALVDEITERK